MPQVPGNLAGILSGFGQEIELQQGGTLTLVRPGFSAGTMSFSDMQNRVWHLLREPGPDTGFAAPTTGDYPQQVVQRDLNIALAQFISQTGLAPKISEIQRNFPVFPGLDYPLPPDLQALVRIDYTIAGQTPYKLIPLSWEEFDRKLGDQIPASTGNPYYYRQSFAGYIRLQPQPTVANFLGYGLGTITLGGQPHAGDVTFVTLNNPGQAPVITGSYTTVSTDTLGSVAAQLVNLINVTSAVQGGQSAFIQPAQLGSTVTPSITFSAINSPGTGITYLATTTSSLMTVTPNTATALTANGDVMTFYYNSTGNVMLEGPDVPGIPPQFHMALVYRVLMDYWRRKQDLAMAKEYERMYKDAVLEAKKLEWDSEREVQPTIAGPDDSDLFGPVGIPY